MAANRFMALFWALGLGVATGFIVGSVVRVPPGLSAIQFTFVSIFVSILALAGLLWTRWEQWNALGPTAGFAIYFLSLFIGAVVLAGIPGLVIGDQGLLTVALQLVGFVLAFAVAAWLCFAGGAWDVLVWVAVRLDIEI